MTSDVTTEASERVPGTAKVALLICAAVVLSLLGLSGCDTVARIPFSDRGFRTVLPVSVTSSGGQCGGIDLGTSALQNGTMSLVFLDDNDEPIKLGEEMRVQIQGRMHAEFVEPGRDDFNFSGGRLYSLPDVVCSSNDDCPSVGECSAAGGGEQLCNDGDRVSGVTVQGEPRYVGSDPGVQALGVVISEAGRWRGYYNRNTFGGFYHFVEEEGPNTQLAAQPMREAAVDPDGVRINSLRHVASTWGNLEEYVRDDERRAYFGLWSFAEDRAQVTSMVAEVSGSMWTRDSLAAEAAAEQISGQASAEDRENVFQSVLDALNQGFDNNQQIADADERALVVLVSGHDERRQTDVDAVISRAQELDVAVSVIQVDRQRTPEPHILRDDWRYYQDAPECSSDADCENFQSCRQAARYTQQADTTDTGHVQHPADLDATWCLPDYDANGRVGPIAEYDRLACETGGAYYYVREPREAIINDALSAVVYASEASWELDFLIDVDQGSQFSTGDPYLLETTLEADIVASSSYRFENATDTSGDRRRVLFTSGQSSTEE